MKHVLEELSLKEISKRIEDRESFRTAQIYGEEIAPGVYAIGSNGLMNDSGEDRVSAVVNWQNSILPISITANIEFIEKLVNGEA